ncbi:MAG: hypothetical protein IJG50_08130, partial [Clostridia bacterium]|nr:hypothetical protein [Clostridia bacterium]
MRGANDMNHAAKRVIAVILAVMMTLGMTGTALAESAPDEYVLNAERLSDVPEGDLIYLGTASAALDEKTAVYSFPVYREGDASEEASVMLRTLDLSAVYGKDYVLLGSGIEKTGSDTSLLERAAAASKEYEGDEYAAEEGASPEREMRPSVQESSLARLVSEQTGEPTRDLYETSGEDLLSSVVDAFVPEQIDKVDYSAQMSVTFAPGETEKTVRFKILDDNKSEGTEAFSILLADPEGAKLWMVTSLAVSIKDDEPAEHSAVSFSSGSYSSKDGVVTVTVERTGAEYSVCSFTITSAGVTADAGANFPEIQDDFFFSPYETERSFDIPVTGEGTFKLTMSDFAACDAGKCTETQITIEESAVPVLMDASAQLQGSSDYSFNIKVNGKSYKVRYTMPSDYNKHGAAKGMIVDTDYKPELEVGEYFFSLDTKHGGMFTYGSFSGTDPGWRGTMQNKYFFDDSKSMDFDKRYGSLKYYSSWVRDKGTQTTSSTNVFPDYFQCFIPDWKSTSGFGGGQEFAIKYGLFKGDSVSGCGSFSRTQDNCGVRINGMGITEGHYIRVQAIDDTKGKTPKSYLEFYGVAAMYKRLNVSIETPNALMYRLGNMSMQSLAMQAHLKSGAQVLYSGSRDFYANPDASKTNLVVNLDSTALNGHTGIFGHVTGFRLTITGSDNKNKKSVNYPEDFITYLEKHKKEWRKGEAKISEDTVNREITKVKENPAVIPYDRFFFAWIEDVQSDIVKSGYGYYQKLSIRPVVEYNDVTVEVLAPTLGFGTGSFLNIASGRTGTFKCHAGDTLNLTAAAADPETNRVIGYEVSTDGGISYDTITSTPYLFLESNRSYKIRPVISPIRNKIEIVFTDEAAKHLSVSGLFSESEKAQSDVLKEFAGQNILIANPEERTVIAQLEPVKGRIYPINFICEEDDSSIYLPVISMGNDTFCTNSYYHVGAGGVADNIIRVDCVRVNKSELTDFTVSGKLISNFAPIRNNGMENIPLPVVGYTVTAGTNTQTAAGTGGVRPESAVALSDENGAFELSHVMGRSGDVIPVVVTNGVTNGQIMSVTLGQSAKTDAGSLQIRYPYGAPYVMDEMVTCEYTMDEFKKNFDTRENQVRIVDDKLKLSAVVNLNGCPLDRAVFTIYTMDGVKTEYRAEISKTDEELAVFECTTDKMTDVLHSGDRICVRLEYVGDDPSVPTVSYPDVDTGFMFYTANDLVAPKTIEANGMKVDIPVVGASTAHMKSGLLNFNTIRWDDAEDGTPTGYTIYVNADALIDYKGKKPTKEKLEALQKLNSQAKEATGRDDPDRLAGAEGIFEDMEDPLEILNPYRDQSGLSSWRSRLRDMRGQMSDAKDAMGGVPFKWTADVVILLSFNFVYDKEQDEYILLSGTAVIGGTFECSKTWYTALMGVPVFLNVNGKVQIDAVVDYPFPEGEAAYTANDFSNYTGNLSEWLPETKADILLNLSGKVTVGVGMCGVASAGGYIAVNLQCDFPVDGKGRAVGALLNVGGGLHFDVVVASLDLTIAEYTQGWGSLEDNATFSFINGLAKTKVPSKSMSASASLQEAVVVLADENELVTARTYSPGSADMSAFGKPKYSFGGSGENEQTLLSGSAERSSPQLLSLDDERQFMVFIGNSGGTQMLYYSVFDGSSWSYPELVADDGTMDVMPELEWMGNKVLIAWTDANSA